MCAAGKATTFASATDADGKSPLYFGEGSYILDPYEARLTLGLTLAAALATALFAFMAPAAHNSTLMEQRFGRFCSGSDWPSASSACSGTVSVELQELDGEAGADRGWSVASEAPPPSSPRRTSMLSGAASRAPARNTQEEESGS